MIVAILAAALVHGPAPANASALARACQPLRAIPVERKRDAAVMPLGEAPPADMHLAVMRRIGPCQIPVIVVKDVERNLTRRASPPADGPSHRR
jgi:hypothetical protein